MSGIYTKFNLDIRFTWLEIDRYRSLKPFVTQKDGSVATQYWSINDWIVLG